MKPVAATIASNVAGAAGEDAPLSVRRSTAGVTVSCPRFSAATKPTSMSGTRPVEYGANVARRHAVACEIADHYRAVIRPSRFAIAAGSALSRMLVRCTGMPNGSRGTIGGGVRTLIATDAAPWSPRSVAISAPLLPAPTTSTR